MTPDFWEGKRVFLTGHTGFKGSWLALWLVHWGAHVHGFSLDAPSTPNLHALAHVAEGMESVHGDIRDYGALYAAMEAARPEIVFHMAAQSLVRPSYSDPVGTYATNVMGTVHVLEAVRHLGGIRAVVNVTSDKCYENRECVWGYRENEAFGGYDPYSSSKGAAELVTAAYRSSYFGAKGASDQGVALASVRAGNVVGGGDFARDRLVPDILRAFIDGRPAVLRNPKAVRPWQHVLEPLGGYLTLAERLWEEGEAFAEGWNFGPADEDARPVEWLAERLSAKWGDGASWQIDSGQHPHEANYLKLDCSKARARLGWHGRWNLEQALDKIVAWYRAYERGDDVRSVVLEQIEDYCA